MVQRTVERDVSADAQVAASQPEPVAAAAFQTLRRRPDFDRVFRDGARAHGRLVNVIVLARGEPTLRLGVVASRRAGGAVARNRAKRVLREAWRAVAASCGSGYDVLLIATPLTGDAGARLVAADLRRQLEGYGVVRP